MHDLTRPVQDALRRCGLQAGIVTVFCSSSTSALTTHVPPATCALSPSHPVTFPPTVAPLTARMIGLARNAV